ncbi:MAG: hypothetical protein PHQ83_00605 [Eubacteriales bacterium]|nr:hypothetical protein [Eubacteriales bacterium]
MQKIILTLLVVVLLGGIFVLVNEDPAAGVLAGPTASEPLPAGVEQLLKGNEFSSLAAMETAQGPVVFAGGIQGLYKVDPKSLETSVITDQGEAFRSVRALLVVADQLWIGHERGVSVLEKGVVSRRITTAEGLVDERVLDLLFVDEQTLYVATYTGLGIVRGPSVHWISGDEEEDSLPGESIKVLFQDINQGIWMGAYNARGGGVLVEHAGQRQLISLEDGLVHNSITSIAQLPDGRIAVGGGVYTEGGASLLRQKDGQWLVERNMLRADGLAGEKVRHIFVDRAGQIWFCSEYDGIAIFAGEMRIGLLTVQEGLSDNEVKKIIQLDSGDYWLATRNGLTQITSDFVLPDPS